jgi:hypothetical protein
MFGQIKANDQAGARARRFVPGDAPVALLPLALCSLPSLERVLERTSASAAFVKWDCRSWPLFSILFVRRSAFAITTLFTPACVMHFEA